MMAVLTSAHCVCQQDNVAGYSTSMDWYGLDKINSSCEHTVM